jgi:hypothetical protein
MRRLLTPGWLACHVLAVGLVVGMLAMAGWVLRGRKTAAPAAPPPPTRRPVVTRHPARVAARPEDPDDPALAAYNRYLAWLSANPGARPVDYPG